MSGSYPRAAIRSRFAERGQGDGTHAIEIDFRGHKHGFEPRGPIIVGPGIGQAACYGHAIEFELESIDSDLGIADPDVATHTQRTGGNRLAIGAVRQPSMQSARIVRLDTGRSDE